MSNAIIIGCPRDWTPAQVLMLDADLIEVPFMGTVTVQRGKP